MNWIANKQWALVVGTVAAVLVWIVDTYSSDIPPEIIPVIAAVATMLNVWSNNSVAEIENQIETGISDAGIDDESVVFGPDDGDLADEYVRRHG